MFFTHTHTSLIHSVQVVQRLRASTKLITSSDPPACWFYKWVILFPFTWMNSVSWCFTQLLAARAPNKQHVWEKKKKKGYKSNIFGWTDGERIQNPSEAQFLSFILPSISICRHLPFARRPWQACRATDRPTDGQTDSRGRSKDASLGGSSWTASNAAGSGTSRSCVYLGPGHQD